MTSEFKDQFEMMREFEKQLRIKGAKKFYGQLLTKLETMHKDTDMTVGMFMTMIEEDADKWILNSAQ